MQAALKNSARKLKTDVYMWRISFLGRTQITATDCSVSRRFLTAVEAGGSRVPVAIALAFAVVGAVALGPDLARYIKIRAM